MNNNPEFAKRMSAVNESLASDPIEVLTKPSKQCPVMKCDGTGWIWMKDWSKRHLRNVSDEWKEPCECYEQMMKQRVIDKKLDLSGIPPIFQDATVASFNPNKYLEADSRETAIVAKKAAENLVKNYQAMKNIGKGLYLYSSIKGSGKTRLASSIANALVKVHGVDLIFIKANDLLSQVKKTYGKESLQTEDQVIRMFREVEVLVIDDVSVEKTKETSMTFAEKILYDVTDYRLEHRKVTIFTSNRTIEDLAKVYTEGRVKSRINKMSLEVYMPEESIRDQEAESENAELERMIFG